MAESGGRPLRFVIAICLWCFRRCDTDGLLPGDTSYVYLADFGEQILLGVSLPGAGPLFRLSSFPQQLGKR